jgi:hypothetical protein
MRQLNIHTAYKHDSTTHQLAEERGINIKLYFVSY